MIKKIKPLFKKLPFILAVILLLAFLFRFYKLSDWFSFGMDQEYEIYLVRNIASLKHFPAIGVNASDTGFYLGPFFIYLSVIPFILFLGNPLGFAVTASGLGLLTTWALYYLANRIFGVKTALFSAFFYAVSFLAGFYDRNFWNPSLVPLLSLLLGFFIFRLVNDHKKSLLYLALIFGFSFHVHLSLLVFLPLIVYAVIKKFSILSKKSIIWSIIIFIFMISPLILFDIRHDFLNSRAVKNNLNKVLSHDSQAPVIDNGMVFINFLGRFFWVPPSPDLFVEKGLCNQLSGFQKHAYPEIIGLISLILIYFLIIRRKFKSPSESSYCAIVINLFLLSLLIIIFYPGKINEYYFLYLLPYLALIMGISSRLFWQDHHFRPLSVFIILLFSSTNLITLFTAVNSYSHGKKMAVVDFAKLHIQNNNYTLEALGDCPRFAGWRYLFEYKIGPPQSSYMDSYFSWLYQNKTKIMPPEKIVLLSMIDPKSGTESVRFWQEEKLKYLTDYEILAQKQFDNVQVFILAVKQ